MGQQIQPPPPPPAAPVIRVKAALPSRFSSNVMLSRSFLEECDNYFILNTMSEEQRIRFALQLMDGDADHWKKTCLATFTQAQHPNWTINWELFKLHFNERFEDTQEREQAHQLLLNGKLVQMTSIQKFADLVKDTCQKAGWNDPLQWKSVLCNGMKKEVTLVLAPHMLLHWNDYLHLAISTDEELQCLKGKDSTPQRKSTTASTSTSRDNKNHPDNSKFKLSDDKKKEHVKQGLCFKCHKKGHNSRECKGERTIYKEFKSGRAQVANVETMDKGKEVAPIEDEDFVDSN
jgi:hypothetical protein